MKTGTGRARIWRWVQNIVNGFGAKINTALRVGRGKLANNAQKGGEEKRKTKELVEERKKQKAAEP